MTRQFNTAGPCKADLHYMLPTEHRLPELRGVIDAQSYFVLHAPRQVGKTTSLLALGASLTAEGRYVRITAIVNTQIGIVNARSRSEATLVFVRSALGGDGLLPA